MPSVLGVCSIHSYSFKHVLISAGEGTCLSLYISPDASTECNTTLPPLALFSVVLYLLAIAAITCCRRQTLLCTSNETVSVACIPTVNCNIRFH